MQNGVPALSNLLLHGAGKSLKGMTLQQFMPSRDDKQSFEHVVNKASDSTAHVLHSTVRDSLCNELRMELFHIPFSNTNGNTHHLIGLREHTDFKSCDHFAESHVHPPPVDVNDGMKDVPTGSQSGSSESRRNSI